MKNMYSNPLILNFFLLFLIQSPAAAQFEGSLDLTFDAGLYPYRTISNIAIQSDGKIIIGGIFNYLDGVNVKTISRLNSDGSIDESFDMGSGPNGGISTSYIQSDGKVIISGNFNAYDGITVNDIARLNSNGSLDETFNSGEGAVGIGNLDGIYSFAIQSDGKIVIGGMFSSFDGTSRNSIARLNSDGSLDLTFNPGSGIVSSFDPKVKTIGIQNDGKIIIGGWFDSYDGTPTSGIIRLNANGSLDNTFNVGSGATDVFVTAIQNDGKIVIAGAFNFYNGTPRNGIARLNSDGTLDETFVSGVELIEPNHYVKAVAIQNDGKIIYQGISTRMYQTAASNIVRLNTDGTIDETFYQDGWITGGIFPWINAIAIQNDGKILIGGDFSNYNDSSRPAIARLHGNPFGIGSGESTEFAIYPNPTTSNLAIILSSSAQGTPWVLRNSLGQDVLSGNAIAGRNDVTMEGLAKGIYAVHVGSSTQLFVMQ